MIWCRTDRNAGNSSESLIYRSAFGSSKMSDQILAHKKKNVGTRAKSFVWGTRILPPPHAHKRGKLSDDDERPVKTYKVVSLVSD